MPENVQFHLEAQNKQFAQSLGWLETSFPSFLLGMERAWEVVFLDELCERIKVSSDIIWSMKIVPDACQSW